MTKCIQALILFLTVSISSFANTRDYGYQITTWDYEATVHENNTWDVTETLHVVFQDSRHGIYRHIPRCFTRTTNENGEQNLLTYHTILRDIDVVGQKFEVSEAKDEQDNLIITIGDKNQPVTGSQTYTIKYTLCYPDDRIQMADFLTHTVLGTDCNTSIETFKFNINFDKPLPSDLMLKTYSGNWGSDDNYLAVNVFVDSQRIYGETTNLDPFVGITLHADLPEGYWQGAMKPTNSSNGYWCIGYLLLIIGALICLFRNSRPQPITVVEYAAPKDINSAEAGVILDGKADVSDLTSLIVWFASKGYLKIREIQTKKGIFRIKRHDIELIKLKDLPESQPYYMRMFWQVFFGGRDSVIISELGDQHVEIENALRALQGTFSGDRALIRTDWRAVLLSLGALILGFMAFRTAGLGGQANDLSVFALLCWIAPILTVMFLRMSYSRYDMSIKRFWLYAQYALIVALCVLDMMLFKSRFYVEGEMTLSLPAFLTLIAGGWGLAFYGSRLRRDTEYRHRLMTQLLGFRKFINTSELPMLKAMVDETPTLFYDILPYAMVFGLTEKWQKQFATLGLVPPDWYEAFDNNFDKYMISCQLTNYLTQNIDKAVQKSSHDPSSDSSSWSSDDGGSSFSGGGGGGGGVGSW